MLRLYLAPRPPASLTASNVVMHSGQVSSPLSPRYAMSGLPPSVLMYVGAYVGLAFGICEWMNGLPFEVKYIWKNAKFSRHLRLIYLTSRYSGLLGLALYPAAIKYVSRPLTSRWTCILYWSFQQYITFSSLAMFLAVFAKRVHALWVYGTKMGIFLFLLVASGFMSNIIVSGWSLSKLDYYERNCLFIGHFPKEIVYLGVKDILIQLCLWSLAFSRCASLRQGFGDSRTVRLISRITRETFVATLLYCVVPLFLVADGIWTDLATQMTKMTYLAFPATVSMTSGVTCRMVRNMHVMHEKALEDQMAGREEGIVLTSTPGTF